MTLLDQLQKTRALAVVRAESIADAAELGHALAEGGIDIVELTFTTADVLTHVARAAGAGITVGVGTVLTAEQAFAAVDAGATFLVSPGVRPEVATVALAADVPVFLGAFTPTEVATALDLGSAAVKIFPAGRLGPGYLRDLHGPYPGVPLLPSGGVTEENAAAFLRAGATAVCAGSGVVPAAAVAAGDWTTITARAARFMHTLNEEAGVS